MVGLGHGGRAFPVELPLSLGLLAHIQEPARGSSAQRKSGVGWKGVSGG